MIRTALWLAASSSLLFAGIPPRPTPPRLVNNLSLVFPNLLSVEEQGMLEQRLAAFNDSTSNQIAVVIVDSLYGYEPWELASRIGETWGLGQKGFDNGVVLLVKPTGGRGERQVFIAVGRGLEGAIPDAVAKEIVRRELLPAFTSGDFNGGIRAACESLMRLASGEFDKPTPARPRVPLSGDWLVLPFFAILILAALTASRRRGITLGHRASPWLFFPMWGGLGRRHYWDDFSHGSGRFGGFGGGSFGGGGAGGSW